MGFVEVAPCSNTSNARGRTMVERGSHDILIGLLNVAWVSSMSTEDFLQLNVI